MKFELPDWVPRNVHVPSATSVTVVPETVHVGCVSEEIVTVRPDDARAEAVIVPPCKRVPDPAMGVKAIDCAAFCKVINVLAEVLLK